MGTKDFYHREKKMDEIDETFDDGLMSGTFRWSKSKEFIQLPPFTRGRVEYCKGWGPYLKSRTGDDSLVEVAKCDSSLLDCLSSPLTTIFWLLHFNFLKLDDGAARCATDNASITVVVFGASKKAVGYIKDGCHLVFFLEN
jgi:hypothetical protein